MLGRRTAVFMISDALYLESHVRTSRSGWLAVGMVRLRSSEPRARNGVNLFLVENSLARRARESASSVDLALRPRVPPEKVLRCHFARLSSCGISEASRFVPARGGGGGGNIPPRHGGVDVLPLTVGR